MAIGEFELIERFFAGAPVRRARLGIGDDCALLDADPAGQSTAVTTDMLVSGRHFLPSVDPESLGHKALAVNLSDLAAMGATPVAFTLALALPEVDEGWLGAFARGLLKLARDADCELVGGDTTRGPLTISITAIGRVPSAEALRRDRARPGDDLWVSGELGAAAFAVREAAAGRTLAADHPARRRLDWPEPRLALGCALRGLANAAIDVSDGLAGDVRHIITRSRAGVRIDWEAVPCAECLAAEPEAERMKLALSGGDDYELLFTAPAGGRTAIDGLSERLGLRLTRIGAVIGGQGRTIVDGEGRDLAQCFGGFDHFG
jgi:thiamine-monophosphate kinase